MISIALATYNGEKYIAEQLKSLLDQTVKPDEVVILDDGSTDRTADIVRAFIKTQGLANWALRVNAENMGFVPNFYQVIDHASGDYIFLCDQDDVWHRDKIEIMTGLLESHPEILALNTGFSKIDEAGNPIRSQSGLGRSNHNLINKRLMPGSLSQFGFEHILWRNISPGCTMAFTKKLKEFFILHRTALCPHDWELNLLGAVRGGLYFYNEPLTDYRIHSGNAIGLKEMTVQERLSAVQDPRVASAGTEYERGLVYRDSGWRDLLSPKQHGALERYIRITEKRYRALAQGKITAWASLLWRLPDYMRLRGPQGIWNDLRNLRGAGKGREDL